MVAFSESLRGNGLAKVHRVLNGLEVDPTQLERARRRFSHSPPSHRSYPSGTTTRSPSPALSDEQRLVELEIERRASEPYQQLFDQVGEEKKRIFEAHINRTRRLPAGSNMDTMAHEIVKSRWIEQGIWKNEWTAPGVAHGRWKHEEPPALESETETDTEESSSSGFSLSGRPTNSHLESQQKRRRPKSDDEKRRIAERRVVCQRQREASRPYHQFVYQISQERERMQEDSPSGEGIDTAAVNTRAYEIVKSTWMKRGIWNEDWGILPGMSWKHEAPLEAKISDGPTSIQANPPVGSKHEAEASPARSTFVTHTPFNGNEKVFGSLSFLEEHPPKDGSSDAEAAPGSNIIGLDERSAFMPPSPAEANPTERGNHEPEAASVNDTLGLSFPALKSTSPQDQPADTDLTGSRRFGGNAMYPSTANPSGPLYILEKFLWPTRTSLPRKRRASEGDAQAQPDASTPHGPVDAEEGTKPAAKKRLRFWPQRDVSSSDPILLPGAETAEAPHQIAMTPPRSSTRIQAQGAKIIDHPTGTVSTDSPKGTARFRQKRKTAGQMTVAGSTEAQDRRKRQCPSTTRRKGRKNGK